jgi:ParB family chromosome partitioning protein
MIIYHKKEVDDLKITEDVQKILIEELREHPQNHEFYSPLDEKEWKTLLKSIEEIGIQEPLWITHEKVLVSGHQRLRAAQVLGLKTVPTRIVEAAEEEIVYLLIMSNEARRGKEHDPMKQARKVKFLKRFWGIRHGNNRTFHNEKSYHDIAREVGKSISTVHRLEKLNELIPELQEKVSEGKIGIMAGCDLADLPEEQQYKLLQSMGENNTVKRGHVERLKPLDDQEKKKHFMKIVGRISRNIGKWQDELVFYLPNQSAATLINEIERLSVSLDEISRSKTEEN